MEWSGGRLFIGRVVPAVPTASKAVLDGNPALKQAGKKPINLQGFLVGYGVLHVVEGVPGRSFTIAPSSLSSLNAATRGRTRRWTTSAPCNTGGHTASSPNRRMPTC